MKTMNRRNLLASSAVAAVALGAPAFAQKAAEPDAGPVNLEALMAPPALGEMSVGAETAKVVIIEYASASCPHCAEFANTEYPILFKDYIESGKVRFIFREFPHNDPAMGAFMMARCAPKERYFPIVEVLFKTQEKWVTNPLAGLKEIALQAGFTEQTFTACLNNQDVAKKIFEIRAKAETFGVQGIPTFFINGKRYQGEYTIAAMKAVIDPLLG